MAMTQMVGAPTFLQLGKNVGGKTKCYDFHCEACELVKHQHVPFPIRNKKETSPFSLTHTDVWGPSRIQTFWILDGLLPSLMTALVPLGFIS